MCRPAESVEARAEAGRGRVRRSGALAGDRLRFCMEFRTVGDGIFSTAVILTYSVYLSVHMHGVLVVLL